MNGLTRTKSEVYSGPDPDTDYQYFSSGNFNLSVHILSTAQIQISTQERHLKSTVAFIITG